jgi:hypothetical protein
MMSLATTVHPNVRIVTLLVSVFALGSMRAAGFAQEVVLHSDAVASSGGQSFKNVVRDKDGKLYCVSILAAEEDKRELIVQASEDGGKTWTRRPFIFNDEASGLTPPQTTTNMCAVAIDDRGVLHVTWGCYSYPSSYHQFYRNWDPATGTASDIFDISAWTGATAGNRTAAMDIAVDQDNTIWLVAHAPTSWIERLAHSAKPYAEGLEFVDVGNISPTASAQTTRIAIDDVGRVHCAFYRNIGNGQFEHRIFDPLTGWGESTNLGNTAVPNDVWGLLAADGLGNVHVLFVEDGTPDSPRWGVRYRRWDEVAGWGEAVTLLELETAQWNGIADNHIFALACDESTGAATVFYRDLSRGGALGTVRKPLDGGFEEFVELAPPTTVQNVYYSPTIRGRLFPVSDRTSHGLHVTWQHRPEPGVPPYSLMFAAPGGSSVPQFRRGDTDSSGVLNISDAIYALSALFIGGSPQPGCLDAADSNDDGLFNLTDPVFSLNGLFLGGPMPPAPGAADCGNDPTGDGFDCQSYARC